MALDAQMQVIVDALAAAGVPAFDTLEPAQARAVSKAMARAALPGVALHRVEPVEIDTADGRTIAARLYVPSPEPIGLLVYFHGGGWVMGDLESSDAALRLLCERSGVAALSVDYRLAPEHPAPAALDDARAALDWATRHRETLLGRVVPIGLGGDSAGANLAAVTAIEEAAGDSAVACQLLFYPVTDCDLLTSSYEEFRDGPILTSALMAWFWGHYVANPAERIGPRFSPLRAEGLSSLPPTLIQTAEVDPLRSEGEAYAARLDAAGVAVILQRRIGLTHGYLSMVTTVAVAADAVIAAADVLRGFMQDASSLV